MDRDMFRGRWDEMKGEIQSQWSKLNHNEITRIEGDIERLTATLQQRYAYSKQQAQEVIDNFLKRFET